MDKRIEIKNYYEYTINQETEPYCALFYTIMYRRWEQVNRLIRENNWKWDNVKDIPFKEFKDITVEYCFKINLDFLKDSKNAGVYQEICKSLDENSNNKFVDLEIDTEICTYDDKRFYKRDKKSVIDIFWNGNQPVLNVTYVERQTMPAKQVMKNSYSMVLDEVGTGKTVAGIYTIQQVIQDRVDYPKEDLSQISILVVCPYNKRDDWYADILRQLGREAIITEQSDNGEIVLKKSKKQGVPHIYISGNRGGEGDDSNYQLKASMLKYDGKPWDLVIIDECHNCFKNYSGIRANKVLLLTATPIVVSGDKVRTFEDYEALLRTMKGELYYTADKIKRINPIEKQVCSEDDIFVCNFKEDLFNNIKINREIEFIECDRCDKRQEWFYKLKSKTDFFTAIYSDQDDNRLADKMREKFPEGFYDIKENDKIETLRNIILGENGYEDYKNDSILIFCETKDSVNLIFDRISGYASDELMIGKLHSDIAEIKNHFSNKDSIMSILKNNIREGKRSILVITGKSGGTGLNLGEFGTVIHYELPFSSNELEQRFGRIERADDLITYQDSKERVAIKNKMVFLINKAVDNITDFETNRMLYYAINKIQKTVEYMPIRNTVLFHPKYIKRVKAEAKDIWEKIVAGLNDDETKDVLDKVYNYINELDEVKKIIGQLSINTSEYGGVIPTIESIVNNMSQDEMGEKEKEIICVFYNSYIDEKTGEKYKDYEKKIEDIQKRIEYYLWLETTLAFWGIHLDELERNMDALVEKMDDIELTDETGELEKKMQGASRRWEDCLNSAFNKIKEIKDSQERYDFIKKEINKLLQGLEMISEKNTYSGVFYRKEGSIVNKQFE